jgi:predicted RNA-binding protein YlqC (UPF0109 family)
MEEFLRYVITQLVEFPDEVVIASAEEEGHLTLRVAMRPSDHGRIIGRGGHTVQAIRSLLRAAGEKRGLKVSLQIIE